MTLQKNLRPPRQPNLQLRTKLRGPWRLYGTSWIRLEDWTRCKSCWIISDPSTAKLRWWSPTATPNPSLWSLTHGTASSFPPLTSGWRSSGSCAWWDRRRCSPTATRWLTNSFPPPCDSFPAPSPTSVRFSKRKATTWIDFSPRISTSSWTLSSISATNRSINHHRRRLRRWSPPLTFTILASGETVLPFVVSPERKCKNITTNIWGIKCPENWEPPIMSSFQSKTFVVPIPNIKASCFCTNEMKPERALC